MSNDKKTISNQHHELKYVADKFGIKPSAVLAAKEVTGSNDRETIYRYLKSSGNKYVVKPTPHSEGYYSIWNNHLMEYVFIPTWPGNNYYTDSIEIAKKTCDTLNTMFINGVSTNDEQ